METYKVGDGDVVTVVDTSLYGGHGIGEEFPFEGAVQEVGIDPRTGPYYLVRGLNSGRLWYVEHDMINHQRTRERAAFAALLDLEGDEDA